ncbi:MAG: DUF5305 domain-containing protein [Natrialbaceae archaeon]|nr:DUF5305 domain-containing protein [Natrialbaceae archaeon]
MTDSIATASLWDRARMRIDRHRLGLIIVVLVLVGVGGLMTYTAYGTAQSATESQVIDQWETSGTIEHSATVTNETTLYPNGSTLENQPVYFTAIAPVLDLEVGGTYLADRARDVTVTLTVDLVSRSVEDETTYWADRSTIATKTTDSVQPGKHVSVNASIPIAATMDRIDTIEEELEAQPGETQIYLAIDWRISGIIEGYRQERRIQDRLVIHTEEGTYRIDESLQLDRTVPIEEEVSVTGATGPWRRYGGPGLLVVGFLGVVGLARAKSLTDEEESFLQYRVDRARYDEVIVPASLPRSADRSTATVSTLGDLARLAIDLDSVVVYDPDSETYQMVTDDLRYVFDPPAEPQDPPPETVTSSEGEALAADGTLDH